MSWNGHHLVGTFVALLVGAGFVGVYNPLSKVGWVNNTIRAPAPCATSAGASCSQTTCAAGSRTTCTTANATQVPGNPVASSCDIFQEAFLTGTKADVRASVQGILADKSANTTARETAKLYKDRDPADTSRQKTDLAIIKDYCSR